MPFMSSYCSHSSNESLEGAFKVFSFVKLSIRESRNSTNLGDRNTQNLMFSIIDIDLYYRYSLTLKEKDTIVSDFQVGTIFYEGFFFSLH